MTEFTIGQKWISHAEPELAMGHIINLDFRTISVYFDVADETRTYASKQAPLTRVVFKPGDQVTLLDQSVVTLTRLSEDAGLITYYSDQISFVETELDPNVRFSKPEDRLFTYQFDDNNWFNLRYETWRHAARQSCAPSRGLYGPRVSLIPHQLYIANEVANRFAPRVLLADEVGLGKTIEAGLIIHQQLQAGRAARILIIVPSALTFQWFVEMIRRFNLHFTVLDEERCQLISADNSDLNNPDDEDSDNEDNEASANGSEETRHRFNPFGAQQLMLCSLTLFTENPDRIEQALESDWDLVVVDEAHHLHWSPENASLEYKVVELLSHVTEGMLLLTATPEQLGRSGHFARLKLLDPNRFYDYEKFILEEKQFEQVADAAMQLLQGDEQDKDSAREAIRHLLKLDAGSASETPYEDKELINALLDRHGTGRVLFRNVRSAIKGFPERIAHAYPLPLPEKYTGLHGYYPETEVSNWSSFDSRIPWLIDLLQARPMDKFLLICAHQETALALEKRLSELVTIRITLFHEGMDLIARDRAALYFAEKERGAQLMICSEIGSEGRNFQFASDLVLFDLPLSPDLLEQRIGRLDRIGQMRDVNIHIPYFLGSAGEYLYRFYHEGVSVFTQANPAAQNIFDSYQEELMGIILSENRNETIELLLATVIQINEERQIELHKGRDRLLELNSHRPEFSEAIVEDIILNESGSKLEAYMEQSFDLFGLESEYSGNQIMTIKPTQGMTRNDSVSLETLDHFRYPELPEEGIRVTYNRNTALSLEDLSFLTWENPIVQQAMDAAISDVTGNSCMIAVKHPSLKAGTLLLEVLHIIDCVAPKKLMTDRYMPPNIVRSLITPNLDNKADAFKYQTLKGELIKVPKDTLAKILDSQLGGIKAMLKASQEVADLELVQQKENALLSVNKALSQEIDRLTELQKVNPSIRIEEIEHLHLRREALNQAIRDAKIRMDAIRVIVAA